MANAYIRSRSPKGNVGVTDVVDAGELSAYSAGVLSGFNATSAASLTLQIGGTTGTQDVAIGKNPAGESELFSGTAGQSIAFIIGSAPATPGYSRTDALVIYKDPFTTSVVNNGVDVTDYQVVAGTAATTGTQVPPNDAAIRAAIPTGSLKFYCVIGYVTIAYAAASITTANYFKNRSLPSKRTVANATELGFITPTAGMEVYQTDTFKNYRYNGTSWVHEWEELGRTTLGSAGDIITINPIAARKYLQVMFNIFGTGGTTNPVLRFNNDSATNYAIQYAQNLGASAVAVSQTSLSVSPVLNSAEKFGTYEVSNDSARRKMVRGTSSDDNNASATTSSNCIEIFGKWDNTSAQITRVDLLNSGGTGDFAIGSELIVLGHD